MKSSIAEIPGLRVLGSPTVCIVAFASSNGQYHVYSLADDLKEKGWLFSCLQYPTWYDNHIFDAMSSANFPDRLRDSRHLEPNSIG